MYSYEDRIRAVRLYLKLGKRIRATIRQLGYPTKNSAYRHHRIPDPGGQGLSVAADRLLRRSCRELDDRHAARC